MAKTKTSKKRAKFSLDDLEITKLPKGVKGKVHNPRKNLSDLEFIQAALLDCIRDGDSKALKEIIHSYYEATNTSDALQKAHVSRSTYYEAIAPKGNPSLETVMKLISPIFTPGRTAAA